MLKTEYYESSGKYPLNREYKSRLFRIVFEDRKDLLDLYNAINGTGYEKEEDLTITVLEDAIYLGMKNDLSFIIGASMNLYEQQSTWNENMPLRGLIYFAGLYQAYVKKNQYNLYGTRRIRLPAPQYIVLYTGSGEKPDRLELCLSDAFIPAKSGQLPCLECKATVLNINRGHNRNLLEKCRRLGEYSELVSCIRAYLQKGKAVEEAVRLTIDECLARGILVDVLTRCRTEVMEVLLTEYNEAETMEYLKKEAVEMGLEQGRQQGQDRVNRLNQLLIAESRYEDLKRSSEDTGYQEKLFQEYHI